MVHHIDGYVKSVANSALVVTIKSQSVRPSSSVKHVGALSIDGALIRLFAPIISNMAGPVSIVNVMRNQCHLSNHVKNVIKCLSKTAILASAVNAAKLLFLRVVLTCLPVCYNIEVSHFNT